MLKDPNTESPNEGTVIHMEQSRMIEKRTGRLELFDPSKIKIAIAKAYKSFYKDKSQTPKVKLENLQEYIVSRIIADLDFLNVKVVKLESIQDDVIRCMRYADPELANAYEHYRNVRMRRRTIDPVKQFESYSKVLEDNKNKKIHTGDANANANMTASFQGFMLHAAGESCKQIALDKIYNEEIYEAHRDGFFHIHDLDMGVTGYCAGWSMVNLLMEGLSGPNCSKAGPAKHFDTALGQINNFIGTLQNEWA